RYARERRVPYFGICLGMQCAVIEYARHVCGLAGANSTEFDPRPAHNVINLLPEQRTIADKGGTMRLGLYPIVLGEGSLASRLYGAGIIQERHRHRYEVNNDYVHELEKHGLRIGGGQPLALIGGPCAIENEKHALVTAERIVTITTDRRVPFIYKSSYDKANRSSIHGHRGPGLTEGLRILKKVRDRLGVPVLSDVHQVSEVAPAAEVLDVLQIPAFLCRQTDLVVAVA